MNSAHEALSRRETLLRHEAWTRPLETAQRELQAAVVQLERGDDDRDLRGVADATARGLGAIFDAYDGRADGSAVLRAAAGDLRATADWIDAVGSTGSLAGRLRAAAAGCLRAAEAFELHPFSRPRPPEVSERLRASVQQLELHAQARRSLVPRVLAPVPPPPPPPVDREPLPRATSFEELEVAAEAIRARVKQKLAAIEKASKAPAPRAAFAPPTEPFAARWARECFDEVALLGMLREPQPGDDWRTLSVFEDRMLANVDAFVAFGEPATRSLEQRAIDAPVRQPTNTFAVALIAGSLAGRDALGMAERVLRDGLPDPSCVASFVAAMLLVPHPDLPTACRSLLEDADPVLRAAAAEIMARRDWLDDALSTSLAADAEEVAQHALLPMVLGDHPSADHALSAALESPVTQVRRRAWEALAAKGKGRLAGALNASLDGPHQESALKMLGLFGGREDVERLIEIARQRPSPSVAEALGATGRPETVPTLIALLDDAEAKLPAARALERITGAGLIAEIEVAPAPSVAREAPDPDVGPPSTPRRELATVVNDPRFAPAEGSPDTLEHPSPHPAVWQRWWRNRGNRFAAGQRYRRGYLLGPEDRWLTHLELAARTRTWVAFDPAALVATQWHALRSWQERIG